MRESEFIKLSNALAVLYVGSPDLKHGIKQIRSLQIQHLKERRKTVRAKRPVQQPKHAITKREKCLHYNTTVDGTLCNECHKKLR